AVEFFYRFQGRQFSTCKNVDRLDPLDRTDGDGRCPGVPLLPAAVRCLRRPRFVPTARRASFSCKCHALVPKPEFEPPASLPPELISPSVAARGALAYPVSFRGATDFHFFT